MNQFAEASSHLSPRSAPRSAAEEYKLKQQQKTEAREKERRARKFKKVAKISAVILVGGGVILGGGWYFISRVEPAEESKLVSRSPIHWHPELKIKILGEYQEIPANIGIGIVHQPIHTHEADGVLHIEPTGAVRENDIKLRRFFEVWGKTFNENCVFEYCSGSEGQLKMFVNGQENFDFGNYLMQDRDLIEIIFE